MKQAFIVIVFCLVVSPPVFAGGVIRPGATLSPRALGMAGAHNAVADDGAALYHNVAGFSQVDDDFVQLNADLILPSFEFGSQESEFSLFPMPELAFATRLSDRLILGGGIYAPYGLGVTYSDGPFRESLLALTNITLALSYQLTDTLSISVGGDIGCGLLLYESSLHQIGDIVINPLFMKTKAYGFGLGFRAGILWQPTDWFSWALSYSSAMKVNLNGETDIQLFGFGLGTDNFDTTVTFPARWGTGIALRPTDDWLVALDVNYHDHGQTDSINFDFEILPVIRQKLEWEDNWSAHLGVEHQIDKNWTIRTGFAWMQHAVPKATTNPIIPDGDGWCAGAGFGFQKDNWSIDFACLHAWVNREVEWSLDHLAPGDYVIDVNVVSFGLTYCF